MLSYQTVLRQEKFSNLVREGASWSNSGILRQGSFKDHVKLEEGGGQGFCPVFQEKTVQITLQKN